MQPRGVRGDDGHSAPAPQADARKSDAVDVEKGGAQVPVEDDDSQDDIKIGHVEEYAEQNDTQSRREL